MADSLEPLHETLDLRIQRLHKPLHQDDGLESAASLLSDIASSPLLDEERSNILESASDLFSRAESDCRDAAEERKQPDDPEDETSPSPSHIDERAIDRLFSDL